MVRRLGALLPMRCDRSHKNRLFARAPLASISRSCRLPKSLWQRRKSHFCDYRHSALGGLSRQCSSEQFCRGDSSCPRIFARIPSLAIFVFRKAFAAEREKLFCLLLPSGWSPAGPPASSKATCDGDNWTQVDGKCVVRRTHKSGNLASATEGPQIAAVPANPSTPPLPVAAPPAPKRDNAAVAAKETEPASAAPVGQPSPAQKTGRRTPRSQTAGRGPDRASAGSHDARSREDQRSARTYASSEDSPRQMPGPKSAMKWARQLQDCIGAVRCRAGEQLMRAFLSGGI
jgi:hypothetical protein